MNNLIDLSVKDFANELSVKKPVPGGGGAAALVGALGISLGAMVGEYTVGKAKYADVEADIKALLKEAVKIKDELLSLVDEDAKAFEPLSKAYAIPKDDSSRDDIMQEALLNAIKAPFRMVELCGKATDVLRQLQLKGSKMLLSDAGCGASLCASAMNCAAMNVYINTKELKDKTKAGEFESQIQKTLEKYLPLADKIVTEVMRELRNE